MDPVSSYGVSPEFVKSPKMKSNGRPGRSDSSNDLVHRSKKSSRKRSSSSSKLKDNSGADTAAVFERSSPSQVPSTDASPETHQGADRAESIVVNQSERASNDIENTDIGLDLNQEQGPTDQVNTESGEVDMRAVKRELDTNLTLSSDDEGAGMKAIKESAPLYATPMRPPLDEVPSFLKRVSVPLGEDLLTILSARGGPTSNATPDAFDQIQEGNAEVHKEGVGQVEPLVLLVAHDHTSIASQDASSRSNRIPVDATSVQGTLSSDHQMSSVSVNESNNITAILSSVVNGGEAREHSRSVSVSNSASTTKCSGCDACRGRVCRPRLSVDFYTSACTLRYFPTVFPALVNSGRRMSRSTSGTGSEMIEKSPMVFWHENFRFAIPYKRTIRLFSSISSAVCPKVICYCIRVYACL